MTTLVGTVTRLLRLDVRQLDDDALQEAVEELCGRLFAERGGSRSTYDRLLAFARMLGGEDQETHVADALSKVLVELFPAGRIQARNSGQLEGLLRTAIRHRLIDASRRRRPAALVAEVCDPRPALASGAQPGDEQVFAEFSTHLQQRHSSHPRRRRELLELARLLYDSGGAADRDARRRLLDQLGVSTATFYRRRSELAVAFLEFLDEG